MKALKTIGRIILVIVIIAVVVPYFLPDSASTSDELQINATPQVIFRQVNNYKNWKAWSPFEADPTMVDTFSGPEQGVGANRAWIGDDAGTGSMTILESDPYKYISNKLEFGPDGGGGIGAWNFNVTEEGTKVVWSIRITKLSYFERWFGLIINFTLKPRITEGLNSLKELTEAMPEPLKVKKIILDPQTTMVVYDSTTMDGMKAMFEKSYGELMTYIGRKQIPITGEQFAVYHNWDPNGYIKISAGIPVDKERKGNSTVTYFELPGGEALFAKHVGGYDTGPTHYAIDAYIKDFNIETRDFIWEKYLYDPMTDTDSTKWVTFIYYPIK